ncbi:hypothetical protein [uncultured Helicobacter sp.]|uniref:hypothetical protein n=1 Tax=uncultured Helicobacter sp. TaxID=175537 RepID=UPI00374EB061
MLAVRTYIIFLESQDYLDSVMSLVALDSKNPKNLCLAQSTRPNAYEAILSVFRIFS